MNEDIDKLSQEKLNIIHVAGTSGKGSTCYLISSLLKFHGFKVGLHQSPHLTDVRERFQMNNKIISEEEFIFYLNKIIPIINMVGKTFHGSLTYFEILVGLAYFIFYDKKIDYVVMETGLGGWFDATNVVERPDKLAVLTTIGLDHANILGKTIEEIALQKGTPTVPGKRNEFANRTPAENRVLFEEMKAGKFPDGAKVVRAKIDMRVLSAAPSPASLRGLPSQLRQDPYHLQQRGRAKRHLYPSPPVLRVLLPRFLPNLRRVRE